MKEVELFICLLAIIAALVVTVYYSGKLRDRVDDLQHRVFMLEQKK